MNPFLQSGGGSSSTGGVTPPASSTDNAIARFDGATGAIIQDSLATIDDNGAVNIPSGQLYKINGSDHTHSYATQADLIALSIALGG